MKSNLENQNHKTLHQCQLKKLKSGSYLCSLKLHIKYNKFLCEQNQLEEYTRTLLGHTSPTLNSQYFLYGVEYQGATQKMKYESLSITFIFRLIEDI